MVTRLCFYDEFFSSTHRAEAWGSDLLFAGGCRLANGMSPIESRARAVQARTSGGNQAHVGANSDRCRLRHAPKISGSLRQTWRGIRFDQQGRVLAAGAGIARPPDGQRRSGSPTRRRRHHALDRSSGTFLAFNPDLTIRTFFKPNDGESYFHRQSKRPARSEQ